MKRTSIIAAALAFACSALAHSVRLAWDPNPEPDIAGYRVYYRASTNDAYSTDRMAEVQGTNVVFDALVPGTWMFVATAFNTSGLESDFSNEVQAIVPVHKPMPPVLRVEVTE